MTGPPTEQDERSCTRSASASVSPGAPNLRGGEGPGDAPGWSGESSDGSYSSGDPEATDANGDVRFTTIFPGWYVGRTTHIHCKVHIDRRTVLTTQLFVDDNVTDAIYLAVAPYKERPLRDTRNDTDSIYDDVGLMTTQRSAGGLLAAINLGLDL